MKSIIIGIIGVLMVAVLTILLAATTLCIGVGVYTYIFVTLLSIILIGLPVLCYKLAKKE